MKTKMVNFQRVYNVPLEYLHVALNHDGCLVGFHNPPVRDFDNLVWIDSVDGSYGELIPFEKWETSVYRVVDLYDAQKTCIGYNKQKEAVENAKKYREYRKKQKDKP